MQSDGYSLLTVGYLFAFRISGAITEQSTFYLEFPMSSYRTCRHLWGLVMLASVSVCQVGNADVFSNGVGEILPLYWANLTTAVTVASMVSHPEDQKLIMSDMNWNRLLTSADTDFFYFSFSEFPLSGRGSGCEGGASLRAAPLVTCKGAESSLRAYHRWMYATANSWVTWAKQNTYN